MPRCVSRPRLLLLAALAGALVLLCAAAPPQGVAPAHAAKRSQAARMVAIARAELGRGVREIPDGSNRGGRILMYGRSTTPRFYPAPWCAYFVSWVARRAGRPLGPAGRGFGYVPYIRAWALATKRWRGTPRPGDLVMFPQHVGMVESVSRNRTLTTIEGNSSNRVARRWRRWSEASGYVRIARGGTVQPRRRAPAPVRRPPVRQPLVPRISVYPGTTPATGQEVGFSANDSGGDIASYRWDLDGDGRFDDARGDNAQRTYTRAGDVKVGLRLRDRRGRTRSARVTLSVRANAAPVAKLVLPRSAPVNSRVTARTDGSHDPDGRIVRYEWDLDGDGQWQAGGDRSEITFRRPGTYTVGLRVFDDAGTVTETVGTVEVTQRAPVARASAPSSVALGGTATFDGSRSYDPDGRIATFAWDFDGDGLIDAEGARPTWTFATPGRRQIRLLVRDAWGAEAGAEVWTDVVNQPPKPVVDPPSIVVSGEEATFGGGRSSDPDSEIARHEWDFDGDGRRDATGAQATWRYAGGGERKLRLRVTDQWGAHRTSEVAVRVRQPPVGQLKALTAAPRAGETTTLSAAGSADPDGRIVRAEWDFDSDGRVDLVRSEVAKTVPVRYTRAVTYTTTLVLVDDHGLRSTTTLLVDVA